MLEYSDWLNAIVFIFTIIIVVYGLSKGFDIFEGIINILYFITLILSQIQNLIKIKQKGDE